MHRKRHTGNQYMVKSAENRMRSNLELLPVMNVKSRPQYISALKKVVPDISRHYLDALNEREIGRYFSDSRASMAVPVSIDGKSILILYYSTLQKVKFIFQSSQEFT